MARDQIFSGKDHSLVSQFSGTDMSIINKLIKEGENTITMEVIPSDSEAKDQKADPFSLTMAITHALKGEMVDTLAKGDIFNFEAEVEPGKSLPKWKKTFTIESKQATK